RMATKPYIIALEEHYQDAEVRRQTGGPGMPGIEERLNDLGALRLKEMDESGIDFQVLSHSIPGLQGVDAATGVPLARRGNDRLAETVRRTPTASPRSPHCRPPIRAPRPTNWSARSRSLVSRAR